MHKGEAVVVFVAKVMVAVVVGEEVGGCGL
jgi:hypothetical protein